MTRDQFLTAKACVERIECYEAWVRAYSTDSSEIDRVEIHTADGTIKIGKPEEAREAARLVMDLVTHKLERERELLESL